MITGSGNRGTPSTLAITVIPSLWLLLSGAAGSCYPGATPSQQYYPKSTNKYFDAGALGLASKDGKMKLSERGRAHHPRLGTPPGSNASTG